MTEKKNPNQKRRTYGLYIAIGVVFLLILSAQSARMQKANQTAELTTSEFITAVEEGRVEAVTYKASAGTLTGTYWETATAKAKGLGLPQGEEPTEISGKGNIADELEGQKDEGAAEDGAVEDGTVEDGTAEDGAVPDAGSGQAAPEEEPETASSTSDEGPHTLLELLGLSTEDEEQDTGSVPFTSTFVGTDALVELMAAHPETEFTVDVKANNVWLSLLTSFVPILLLLGVFIFFMSQMNGMNGKQMQFGKTKAKKSPEERPDTKYSDVAGIDEALEELKEVSDFLANPAKYQKLGAKIPRGVLLVGPPGCGKTLLAKAVAGEAGVPFFSISGSDFVEMFVGVGASRVRDLFEQAREAAPSIIFIDEIDAVGRQRGAGLGGGHDEREQTLNQLLVEMDGFDDHESVILIAATNRVDILDPALLRPGRFDRQITVQPPDLKGREQILQVHAKGKPFSKHVDMATVAKLTPGFSGADLANLTNEAALLTARRNKSIITMDEVNEAMERIIAGPERKGRIMTEAEKRTIAYHESGHALVGHLLEHADPVHKISIIARGQALGYTLSLPEEDRFLSTRSEMQDELAMFLGGRVAEEIACGDITTGASNDLERATKMAKQMVTRYGMTEALGSQVYGEASHNPFLGRDYSSTPDYSEATATKIDEEVARIMRHAHDVAHKILTENREQLDLMASVLLERETVEGEAVQALLDNKWDEYLEHEEEILARKAEEQRLQEEEDARQLAEAQAAARAAAQTAASPEDEYWQGVSARAKAWETGESNPIRDAALQMLEDSPRSGSKDAPKPPIIDGVPADQLQVKQELERARQQAPLGAEPIGDPTLQIPAQPEDMEWVEADETCTVEFPEEAEEVGIDGTDEAGADENPEDTGK